MDNSEELIQRREFVYSSLSLVLSLLTWTLTSSDQRNLLLDQVTTEGQLQLGYFLVILIPEGVKAAIVFYLVAPSVSKGSWKGAPFSGGRNKAATSRWGKISELGGVVWSWILCCGVCHVFVVLFGAPFLSKFVLTAQFSGILTAWMFTPLTLVFPPRDILKEVVYFSTWNTGVGSIFRAKLRLISTVAGGMAGAVTFPLDWDRPWQVWPVPCLVSGFVTVILVNALFTIYFFHAWLRGKSSRLGSSSGGGGSKTKNF